MFKLVLLFLVLISSNINCADYYGMNKVEHITGIQQVANVKKHSENGNVQYSGTLQGGAIIIAVRYNYAGIFSHNCKLQILDKIIEYSKNPKEDFEFLEKIFIEASGFEKLFASFR